MQLQLPSTPFTCQNLVGGAWRAPARGETREVISPYTGKVIGTVPMSTAEDVAAAVAAAATAEDVAAAVAAAATAAAGWARTPLKERTQIMFRFRELLLANLDELAHSAAAEAGKTVAEARAGILKGVEVCEFALSLQNLDDG